VSIILDVVVFVRSGDRAVPRRIFGNGRAIYKVRTAAEQKGRGQKIRTKVLMEDSNGHREKVPD